MCVTYKSRPSAGPPCSTSDTMIDVSPLSTLGLSRPPDTAMPKPIFESCRGAKQRVSRREGPRVPATVTVHLLFSVKSGGAEHGTHLPRPALRKHGRRRFTWVCVKCFISSRCTQAAGGAAGAAQLPSGLRWRLLYTRPPGQRVHSGGRGAGKENVAGFKSQLTFIRHLTGTSIFPSCGESRAC